MLRKEIYEAVVPSFFLNYRSKDYRAMIDEMVFSEKRLFADPQMTKRKGMASELTPKQAQILRFIGGKLRSAGSPPTLREIGQRFGISSTGAVQNHLTALFRKGVLRKVPGIHRGLRLTSPVEGEESSEGEGSAAWRLPSIQGVPILGQVVAGQPLLAEECLEGHIDVDRSLLPKGSVIDFLTLVEKFDLAGVSLVSLKEEINTASASGRVMTTIMIALAQFEREQTSERTKEKMAWRAGKGLPIGPPPLGYRMHEKRFQVVPEEAEAVRFIEQAYLKTRSLNQVVKMAHERGIRTRRGGTLTKDSVSHVLHNPLYTGWICLHGQRSKGQHEPLRNEEVHRRIGEILERNNNRNGNGISKAKQYEYLLQGLVVCGYCRSRMVPRTSMGRGGNPYHYYICGRADKTAGVDCRQNFLNAVEADEHVLGYAKDLAWREDLVQKLCRERDVDAAKVLSGIRSDRERVKAGLAENRRQATNLVKLMARMGDAPGEALITQCQELDRAGKELEASLERLSGEITKLESTEIRADRAGRTVRYLSGILRHEKATATHLRDILPKFVDYVVWRRNSTTRKGRFEVAFFERPFRADRGRLLREVVQDLGGPGGAAGGDPRGNGKTPRGGYPLMGCGPTGPGLTAGYGMGCIAGRLPFSCEECPLAR